MSTLHLDCRSQGMMESIIADRQERYSHVEFISWNNNILVLAYIPWCLKSVASTIIVVWLRNNYQYFKNYDSKTDHLLRCDNCAWFFSVRSVRAASWQYDNCRCAWYSLLPCAWLVLEQYDNWQMVLQGAVEIYAPLGEFHPPWIVRDLKSTIIVLGNIRLNSAWRNSGSTIIDKVRELWERQN